MSRTRSKNTKSYFTPIHDPKRVLFTGSEDRTVNREEPYQDRSGISRHGAVQCTEWEEFVRTPNERVS